MTEKVKIHSEKVRWCRVGLVRAMEWYAELGKSIDVCEAWLPAGGFQFLDSETM